MQYSVQEFSLACFNDEAFVVFCLASDAIETQFPFPSFFLKGAFVDERGITDNAEIGLRLDFIKAFLD